LSSIIDREPAFRRVLLKMLRLSPDMETAMKCALVWGLNLGIRIGENRHRTANASPKALKPSPEVTKKKHR
jgi:hypothetical protein